MGNENFDEVAAAYAQVKQTADTLIADYKQTCSDIEAAEAEMRALPLAPVPFEDMKEAILEFVDSSGERYAADYVRRAITQFATGLQSGGGHNETLGKPLTFARIEGAVNGADGALGRGQLLDPEKNMTNDQVLYYFCHDLVCAGLRKIMDQMEPAEFGYDKIHPDKIGSPRIERRAAIALLQERLGELRSLKADLAGKLAKLGFPVPLIAKSKP